MISVIPLAEKLSISWNMYIPPEVIIVIPNTKCSTTMDSVNSLRCGRNSRGNSSTMPVMKDSTVQNWESIPSTSSIMKKSTAQNCAIGSFATASG